MVEMPKKVQGKLNHCTHGGEGDLGGGVDEDGVGEEELVQEPLDVLPQRLGVADRLAATLENQIDAVVGGVALKNVDLGNDKP